MGRLVQFHYDEQGREASCEKELSWLDLWCNERGDHKEANVIGGLMSNRLDEWDRGERKESGRKQ